MKAGIIKKGDKVQILGSAEENKYRGCVFEVVSDPWNVCGQNVVRLKNIATGTYMIGGYATEFLRPVPA